VHLEEDAGKNMHPAGADYSLVDLNRAGTPLLEIVSEPQIHSAAEAKAYARELYLIMKYAQVSDVDLYHGNMRFDVNISVSLDPNKPGKRAEVKNLNSFRSVENAVNYEIDRQIKLYESGQKVVQETRGWDDDKQQTTSQRGKEEAQDYRYMPEPDIPPVELNEAYIQKIKQAMPILPVQIREILNKLSISSKVIEDLLDQPELIPRIMDVLGKGNADLAKRAAFDLLRDSEVLKVRLQDHIMVGEMAASSEISSSASVELLNALKSETGAKEVANRLNLLQVSDVSEIEKIVQEVLDQNQQAAQDVKNGETKAIGFLVGQVMAKSKGQANPQIAQQIIKQKLNLQ
jgi:aspartyl-tRNA(Asn)/glutamyl-tRNA(Gln) amidotransferase subunit B